MTPIILTVTKLEADRVDVTVLGAMPRWTSGRTSVTFAGQCGLMLTVPDFRPDGLPVPKIGDKFVLQLTAVSEDSA